MVFVKDAPLFPPMYAVRTPVAPGMPREESQVFWK